MQKRFVGVQGLGFKELGVAAEGQAMAVEAQSSGRQEPPADKLLYLRPSYWWAFLKHFPPSHLYPSVHSLLQRHDWWQGRALRRWAALWVVQRLLTFSSSGIEAYQTYRQGNAVASSLPFAIFHILQYSDWAHRCLRLERDPPDWAKTCTEMASGTSLAPTCQKLLLIVCGSDLLIYQVFINPSSSHFCVIEQSNETK